MDYKHPKATKGTRSAGVRSSSHFEKKCSCTTIPALQSVATCVTPSKNETFYMAKLIYHPYYSTTRTVSATQDGNYPIFNLSSQKCVSTRSPSSSTLEASETFSFPLTGLALPSIAFAFFIVRFSRCASRQSLKTIQVFFQEKTSFRAFRVSSETLPSPALFGPGSTSVSLPHSCFRLLPRKEVIQPHLPIRLPCYDFTPVIGLTFDCCLLR